jgi:regulator of protease activity HflC (stomatin/prohibitin superfamily)
MTEVDCWRSSSTSFYTVDQNERAVKTIFGRAERVGNAPPPTHHWQKC